jgi:hypothetical protein
LYAVRTPSVIEDVQKDDAQLASHLRIKERKLETGGWN